MRLLQAYMRRLANRSGECARRANILLNNLLYDISEVGVPFDNVDAEALQKPAHWDIKFIERFMLVLGPVSSIFDFF